ncbi:uncharacterized protein LOC126880720 [Diabrotica virgifera virgifera]|uniref:Juvenile hormone acid O-methyltransferase-like n=1 Tax=Diabrotica virgifera virgifera TaxID=50390 RepID=A0ABM5JS05_DIAVI|nr:uncharacterized protein LOC126880720 [Diabrotica virgifera virgifera]
MLKPGGQVFVSCFEHKPVDEAFAKLAVHLKWKKYGDHTSAYYYKADPKSEYEKDLAEAGFKDYMFDVVMENLCISVNPAMLTVSKEDMEEYTECYLNEVQNSKCFTRNTPEDNDLTMTYKMFIIIATKSE